MRLCVVGAGAIGGLVGARLALGGEAVSFIARGASLAAIRRNGIRVTHPDGRDEVARVEATDDFAAAGTFDAVLLALKAHQLPEVAPRIAALCRAGTMIVPMQNGIPFWYFHDHGAHAGLTIESVDPGGRCAALIPAAQVVGSVVYLASELAAPGHVRHHMGDRIIVGELDGRASERLAALARAFVRAGFKSPVSADIRGDVWVKLWGNVAFNPISALTGATLAEICADADSRALAAQAMREAAAVGEALGVHFGLTIEQRIAGASRVGAHKTSMLQDLEAGRPLELGALVGCVVELGAIAGVPTPTIRALHQAASLLDRRRRGCAAAPAAAAPLAADATGWAGAPSAAGRPAGAK